MVAAPEDDAPRLVLADLLSDRGDPWGELIAVQCRLARLPRGSPGRRALVQRERELFEAHREQWTQGLETRHGYRRLVFRRGFVERALSPAHGVPEVSALRAAEPLLGELLIHGREVSMSGEARDYAEAYGTLPEMGLELASDVARLDVSWARSLGFADAQLWEPGVRLLVEAGTLRDARSLVLADCSVDDAAVRCLAAADLPDLRELDLEADPLGDEGCAALARAPMLQRLERLSLGRSLDPAGSAETITATGLKSLLSAAPGRLRALSLSSDVGEEGLVALAECGALAGLVSLELSTGGLTRRAAEALARAPWLSGLERLVLRSSAGPGPAGMQALAAAPWKALKRLELGGVDLGVEETGIVAGSLNAPCLEELALRGARSGDPGAVALAGSPLLDQLRELDLAGNVELGDAGARALAGSPRAKGLLCLFLGGTKVGLDGARALLESENLAGLGVLVVPAGKGGRGSHELAALRARHEARFEQLDLV